MKPKSGSICAFSDYWRHFISGTN